MRNPVSLTNTFAIFVLPLDRFHRKAGWLQKETVRIGTVPSPEIYKVLKIGEIFIRMTDSVLNLLLEKIID